MCPAWRSLESLWVNIFLVSSKLRTTTVMLCFTSCASTWKCEQGCFFRFKCCTHSICFYSEISALYDPKTICNLTEFFLMSDNESNKLIFPPRGSWQLRWHYTRFLSFSIRPKLLFYLHCRFCTKTNWTDKYARFIWMWIDIKYCVPFEKFMTFTCNEWSVNMLTFNDVLHLSE